MKRFLVIITVFFVLSAVTGCGVVRRELLSKMQNRNGLVYIINEQNAYTGVLFEQHENGQLRVEVTFKDGKQYFVKEWDKNGQLQREKTYKDGNLEGLKRWYKNGQLESEETYKDDKLDGVAKNWYENGQLCSEITFKDGNRVGVEKWWYENGQKKELEMP